MRISRTQGNGTIIFSGRFASSPGEPLVSATQADRILYVRGLQDWSECGAQETIGLYSKKLYLILCSTENGIHRQHAFADQWVHFRSALIVNQSLLVAACLPPLSELIRCQKGHLLLLTAFGIGLGVLPFFVADRLRFPLLCLFTVFAATGISFLVTKLERRLFSWLALSTLVAYGVHRPPNVPRLDGLEALEWERLGALSANQKKFHKAKVAFATC